MIGGTNKTSSIALGVAIAGMAFGTSLPATAADLGGGAYADLEERIAELEATTARKGNRKVGLTITGNVNQALFYWDDGFEDNVYVQTSETNPTKIRFHGDAKITDDWKAGYVLELGISATRQDKLSQNDPTGGSTGISIRHSAWYLDSKTYGRVWVGHTSDAADGILEINLANTGHFANSQVSQWFGDGGSGFFLRGANGALSPTARLGHLVVPGGGGTPDGHRFNLVKYETPTIAGFKASAAWGEDDLWNVALRYAGEYAGFKLAAGIAYSETADSQGNGRRGLVITNPLLGPDQDVEEWGLSGSLLHEPTGLFLTGAYGHVEDNNAESLLLDGETEFYYIQAGIERKWFPLGATTLYGEYFSLDRGAAVSGSSVVEFNGAGTGIIGSELEGWGLGVNQNLNGAIDVYLAYRHLDVDVSLANATSPALESFDFVLGGANIKF